MEYISELVKNICVFMILTTVVNNLLQDSVYRKYIRLYVGIVIVILIINPVLSLLSMDTDFDADIEKYIADAQIYEAYDDIENADSGIYSDIICEYRNVLDDSMNVIAGKYGLYVVDSEWDIEENPNEEFGKINNINVSFAYTDEVVYVVKDDLYRDIEYEFTTGRENIYIEII